MSKRTDANKHSTCPSCNQHHTRECIAGGRCMGCGTSLASVTTPTIDLSKREDYLKALALAEDTSTAAIENGSPDRASDDEQAAHHVIIDAVGILRERIRIDPDFAPWGTYSET